MATGTSVNPATSVTIESATPAGLRFNESYKGVILFIAAVVVGFVVQAIPIASLSYEGHITLAVFSFVVVMWIGEVLPVGVSAVLFCMTLVVLLGKKMPAEVVFSGFSSPTIWLLIGTFLLGEATVTTGVAHRIAYLTMRLGRSSYRSVLLYLWLTQLILGLLVPSTTVRAAMFVPIMLGIGQAYKAKPGSRLAANLLLHVFWSIQLGSLLWYTGTIINPQIMGILRSVTGYSPSFAVFVIWNLVPCAIYTVCTFLIIQWIMPAEKELTEGGNVDILDKNLALMGPMSANEWKSFIFFVLAITLWATEKFHHIDTAWVALGLGAVLFLPKVGVLKEKALHNINWNIVLLMAVALSMLDIMKRVKLDLWVTEKLLGPILNPLAALGSCGLAFGMTIAAALIHLIASSAIGETALTGPLVIRYAQLMGYNPILAALVVAKAEMNVFLFPYQMTPLLVLWGTGYMDMKKCLRCFGVTCIFNIVWITAMAPVWEWGIRLIK